MERYDVATLVEQIRSGKRFNYLCFWGHQPQPDGKIGPSCLSQWWSAPFQVDGIRYPTAEHFMMAEKARLFGDEATLNKIIATPHPREAKKLGRLVRGFAGDTWSEHRFGIVVRGNLAKFSQNEALTAFLLGTKQQVLVEASPVDKIWGIGLATDSPQATHPEQWPGLNLLGFALMKVRSALRGEAKGDGFRPIND